MKIKLLVTDDSAFMRTAVRLMVKDDLDIEIVGEARDGQSAVSMVEALNPDVVTMDVEMPGMDGLAATKIIMERFPRPIIMLSSMTERGAATTIKALELGAVDFISKKSSFVQLDIVKISNELHEKIRYWGIKNRDYASARFKAIADRQAAVMRSVPVSYRPDLTVIGVSTGGPAIMPNLLRAMGKLSCPVVIAQHMPQLFTEGFARHLKTYSGLNVLQASDGMKLTPGMVAICPGAVDTCVREPLPGRLSTLLKFDAEASIHPSVDILFESAARLNRKVVGVVLTGMGKDGTIGARSLSDRGFPVLAQEPTECVVDGMPMSAISSGAVCEILTVEGIGRRLRKWAGTENDN